MELDWPFAIILNLSEAEKQARRDSLDNHALFAHFSAILPLLIALFFRLGLWLTSKVSSRGDGYTQVPRSPVVKAQRSGAVGGLAAQWRLLRWWLDDDMLAFGQHWGRRDEWVFGIGWFVWLFALCWVGTGEDFLHLTKRFGLVAVSQLPIQYVLALKSINPYARAFQTSHESINRFHRVLGRVIYTLLIIHAILYNIFFLKVGVWQKRFFAPVVFAGVMAFMAMHLLNATAAKMVREWSYRVFFVAHLTVAFAIPALLFFHAPSSRFYITKAIAVFLIDLGVRKVKNTVAAPSSLEVIPGTSLFKITAVVSPAKAASYQAKPGSHVYVSLPPETRPSPTDIIYEFLFNPFTVASTNEDAGEITLVGRNRSGPMTNRLHDIASTSAAADDSAKRTTTLTIEGPYGAAGKTFKSLVHANVDRILFVAGGVGATFTLPIYHAILREIPSAKVKLIWAIRTASDATWAAATTPVGAKPIMEDDRAEFFLTGDMGIASPPTGGNVIEMRSLRQGRTSNPKRPDFAKIVDDIFRLGTEESVAIFVCGPSGMARDVRARVTPWVKKGRRVWWHDESFGW